MSAPFWAAEHWCQEESGKVRHSFELVVLGCALLMLPAVLIQDSSLHSPWTVLSWVLGTFVWLAFTVELGLTLHYAQDRRAALRAHWADVVVVVAIFPLWGLFFAALGPRWLRGWRLARLWVIAARIFRAEGLLTLGLRRGGVPHQHVAGLDGERRGRIRGRRDRRRGQHGVGPLVAECADIREPVTRPIDRPAPLPRDLMIGSDRIEIFDERSEALPCIDRHIGAMILSA